MSSSLFRSLAAALASGVVLAVSVAGSAGATSGPDLGAAAAAARSVEAGKLIDKAAGRVAASSKSAAAVVQQDAVPVYALNPAFVTGQSAEVASLWYVATSATKGNANLTVYTAPDQSTGSWQAVNVATGNTESRMAASAKGAQLFTEPQIGAWYALTANNLRPLNPSAVKAIGPSPITVTAYQALVTTRYANKQPGSTYATNGTAAWLRHPHPPRHHLHPARRYHHRCADLNQPRLASRRRSSRRPSRSRLPLPPPPVGLTPTGQARPTPDRAGLPNPQAGVPAGCIQPTRPSPT